MLTKYIHFKKRPIAMLIVVLLMLNVYQNIKAQTLVTNTLTAPVAPGQYYAYNKGSITFGPGFSANGTNGSFQFYIATGCALLTTTPTASMNYIMVSTPRISGYVPGVTGYTDCQLMQSIQYFDGLGRSLQTVQVQASPNYNDLVQPQAYDQFGREATKYLPYAVPNNAPSDGSYKANALITDQNLFYTKNTPAGVTTITTPQAVSVFEPSPLNRVIEQGAPGDTWQPTGTTTSANTQGHTVKMVYTSNDGTAFWANQYSVSIDASGNRSLIFNGKYAANQLYVTVSRDENWNNLGQPDTRLNSTEEYKDKMGHVVLKRTYNSVNNTIQILSTYYVYDDLGNLAYVLPPLSGADVTNGINSTNNQITLDNLCYQYSYDARNRLTQKKLPGKGWEYMVYNQLDQLVLSQDANQRANNQWAVTKYDALGRVIVTGLWNAGSAVSLATLQTNIYASNPQWDVRDNSNNTGTNPTGYVINTYPAISQVLTVNYYDDYTFTGQPSAFSIKPTGANTIPKGLPTATKTTVLNTIGNATPDMLWKVMYYDGLGRNIMTYAQHYLGGTISANNYDAVAITYNFTNVPTAVTRQHYTKASTTAPLVTIANTYTYDQVGRKLQAWEQITNGTSTPTTNTMLSQMVYNEVGQVTCKKLHSTDGVNFAQSIGYNYNERGWLLGSSAPLFSMQLQYNTGANKQYNGNIASQSWQTQGQTANTYSYTYDNLNRLTGGTSTDNYNETGINYDLMGNITALNRTNPTGVIDQLTYNYVNGNNPSNQLQSITDGSGNAAGLKAGTSNFTYDGNGNMITDPTKGTSGINIAYNLLNLPQSITGSKTITYTYDAAGNKLRRVSTATNNTDYVNGIQYDGTTTQNLTFIQTEEGKAVPTGSNYDYVYYIGDNLGNTRVTFDVQNNVATALQKDDYYPFGFEISRLGNGAKNEYLYNKKELQEELTQYDYGARFYDPLLGRWTSPDPLAEFHYETTPYNYVLNNPISFMDLLGLDTIRMNSNAPIHTGDVIEVSPGNYTTSNTNEVPIVGKKSDKDDNKDDDKNSSFDFDKQAAYLDKHSFSQYIKGKDKNGRSICGHCALIVRLSLEAGGMNTNDRPTSTKSAKNYGPYLQRKGYKPLNPQNYTPAKGDIRVWQPYPGGNPNGHIDVYDGGQWVSDFKENPLGPGEGYRKNPDFEIYRRNP